MNPDDSALMSTTTEPTKEEVASVRKIVAGLQLARKNYSLYPEGHSICLNSLNNIHGQLIAHLNEYGALRLDVERDQLVYHGEAVYSGNQEDGSLSFILYRDGIKWIAITDGISLEEAGCMLTILNKYSIITDGSEGDIVTALWESRLSHISYEVAESFWEAEQEPDIDFSFNTDIPDETATSLRENKLADWAPVEDPPIDQASIRITAQDRTMLEQMVRAEEEADPTEYLDALFDSLLGLREKDNFEIILEVLGEEFKGSLARKSFDISLKILKNVHYVNRTCSSETSWVNQIIEDFFLTVSGSKCLAGLRDGWSPMEPGRLDTLRQVLMLLQPEAVHTLVDIMMTDQPPALHALLEEAVISLASRDQGTLEALLKSPDERLGQILVRVLVGMKGEQSLKALKTLARHPSGRVRHEALKGVIHRVPVHTREIFKLIDDKDAAVRSLILKKIGSSRDQMSEGLLLDYIQRQEFEKADTEHVGACFVALGQCGSKKSVPFLKSTLLHRGWMPGFWRPAHRKGAAIALTILGIDESRKVLDEAGRSLFPSVRRIVGEVRKELLHKKGG